VLRTRSSATATAFARPTDSQCLSRMRRVRGAAAAFAVLLVSLAGSSTAPSATEGRLARPTAARPLRCSPAPGRLPSRPLDRDGEQGVRRRDRLARRAVRESTREALRVGDELLRGRTPLAPELHRAHVRGDARNQRQRPSGRAHARRRQPVLPAPRSRQGLAQLRGKRARQLPPSLKPPIRSQPRSRSVLHIDPVRLRSVGRADGRRQTRQLRSRACSRFTARLRACEAGSVPRHA
jgi:hypothetical protein